MCVDMVQKVLKEGLIFIGTKRGSLWFINARYAKTRTCSVVVE